MKDSWESTALRLFKREDRQRRARKKARKVDNRARLFGIDTEDAETLGCFSALSKFGVLWLLFTLFLGAVPGLLSAVGTLALVRFFLPRLRISDRLNAYRAGELGATLDVYRFAVEEFREEIERHRERTLGRKSEWGAAREVLVKALDDADRSAAYWGIRRHEEPSDRVIARQLDTAIGLKEKLGSALGKLDRRADVLRRFFNECEAKVSVLDRYNNDIEESRRLDGISATADLVIADAEATLTAIGASFVREAKKVGEALGDFETLQLKTLAGEVPLDNIEVLADRINEASESKYAAVDELRRVIGDFAEPIGS